MRLHMLISKRVELRLECELSSWYQNYMSDILEIFLLRIEQV